MPWSHHITQWNTLTTDNTASSQLYQTLSNYTDVHRRHSSTALTMTAHSYIRLSLVKAELMREGLFSLSCKLSYRSDGCSLNVKPGMRCWSLTFRPGDTPGHSRH